MIPGPSSRYDEKNSETNQFTHWLVFLSFHMRHRQAFLLIYLIGDNMRRKWVKGRQENLLFLIAMVCLLILLSLGLKEQLFCLVYPGISYMLDEYDTDDSSVYKMAAGFSSGYYGYMEKYMEPEICVENSAGARELLMAYELNPGEIETDEQHNEGMAEDESMNEVFLTEGQQEEILAENGVQSGESKEFIKAAEPAQVLDYEALLDFDYLKKHFYTVDSSTNIGEDRLNARKMLEYDATISTDASQPQILIYHTHSQEGFADSIPGDASTSIVGVGDKLAQILQDEYGFNVIHHTGVYDVESRDYAYSAAGPAIEQILEENPSIEVVIDLHRDGVADTTRLVTDVGGRNTAQFMFFNGLSYLNSKGNIDYLENPYIEENLAFSFQMKLAAEEYYPNFARNIYLKGLRYNMHYRAKSLLIEVGAQTNTVEEAMNAAEPIAHILAMVLKGEKP